MTDPIESPEDFARNVGRCFTPSTSLGLLCLAADHVELSRLIRARDAAVRREALREASDWLAVHTAGEYSDAIRALADSEET